VVNLPGPLRAPHIVLGADLIYTAKMEVIDALAATLDAVTPVGRCRLTLSNLR